MVISKSEVKLIEKRARMIMNKDFKIGAEKTAQQLKGKSLPYIYYHIFEDANFHSLNKELEQQGILTGTYTDAQEDFNEYRKAGGRTWKLTM